MTLQRPHSLLYPLDLTRVRDRPYVLGQSIEIGFSVNPTPIFLPITPTSSVQAPSLRRISIAPPSVALEAGFALFISRLELLMCDVATPIIKIRLKHHVLTQEDT